MAGTASSAFTTVHPIRWVNETLPPPRLDASHRLVTRRFSSSSLAGTKRNDVAVGISSDASMFVAIRAATPTRGRAPPGGGATIAAGGGAEDGAGAVAVSASGGGDASDSIRRGR